MKIDYKKLLNVFKDKYDEILYFNKHDYEIYKEYLYQFDKLIDDEIEFAKLAHKFEDSVNDAFSDRYCLALMFALEELGLLDAIESGRIEEKSLIKKSIEESLNFKNYAVEVMGSDWFKPFYWYFNEFKDELLIASEEYGFTYYITEATTTEYRINIKFDDNLDVSYDIKFRIIPRTDKATAKELNDYLN